MFAKTLSMAAITGIALEALDRLAGPRILLAAIPGGARAVARAAGVSPGRVRQVLRSNPLPPDWAKLLADLLGCAVWEVYEQLGQRVSVADARTETGQETDLGSPASGFVRAGD